MGGYIAVKKVITGEGNFSTVELPAFDGKDDFKIYDPDVKQEEGRKIFEQVIIPKTEKVNTIPEISFNFFDTRSGEYKTITRGPIPIKVNPLLRGEELKVFETAGESSVTAARREILGRDIIYIKDNPGVLKPRGELLVRNKLFIAVQFIPLLAVIAFMIFQRRKERIEKDISYARRLRAPRKARQNMRHVRRLLDSKEPNIFFDAVFKTLQEYLGDKFHLSSAGITSDVIGELKARNVDKEILGRLSECFANCDMARYASSSVTRDQMVRTFKLLGEIIDEFERMKA